MKQYSDSLMARCIRKAWKRKNPDAAEQQARNLLKSVLVVDGNFMRRMRKFPETCPKEESKI